MRWRMYLMSTDRWGGRRRVAAVLVAALVATGLTACVADPPAREAAAPPTPAPTSPAPAPVPSPTPLAADACVVSVLHAKYAAGLLACSPPRDRSGDTSA